MISTPMVDQRKEIRRKMDRTCEAHTMTMRGISDNIGKMVPIWVFLTSLSLVTGIFGYVTYLTHGVSLRSETLAKETLAAAEKQTKETSDLARVSIKELSESLQAVRTNQAVTLFRLDDISKDINDLKNQKQKGVEK